MPTDEVLGLLAEIAGIFVGFGALISVRSGTARDEHAALYLLTVVTFGLWVVSTSLVALAVGHYGVHGHARWLTCGLIALILYGTGMILMNRSRLMRNENRWLSTRRRFNLTFYAVGLPLHLIVGGSLILIIVGVWPDVEPALYLTSLVAGQSYAGLTLLMLVVSQTVMPAD